jgi:hypothetical protein
VHLADLKLSSSDTSKQRDAAPWFGAAEDGHLQCFLGGSLAAVTHITPRRRHHRVFSQEGFMKQSVCTVTFAIALLVNVAMSSWSGEAEAAIVSISIQGTVGLNGDDQSTTGAGVFGAPGSLAGQPFMLTTTVDDAGGQPLVPDSANVSSVTGVHSAVTTLTIGGASVTLGSLPNNNAQIVKALGPASFNFAVSGSQTTGANVDLDSVELNLAFAMGNSPFGAVVDWHAPFSYAIAPADQVSASFAYRRSGIGGTVIAGGDLLPAIVTVSSSGPSAITPTVGLWWNPAESGSGYAIDYKHGVLVVTVYSYTAAGAPLWYLAAGPVTNNVFTSTLDKYQNGQCISCSYRPAAPVGNDGPISITFTSANAATMTLPGGRSFQIVPQAF